MRFINRLRSFYETRAMLAFLVALVLAYAVILVLNEISPVWPGIALLWVAWALFRVGVWWGAREQRRQVGKAIDACAAASIAHDEVRQVVADWRAVQTASWKACGLTEIPDAPLPYRSRGNL